MEIGGSFWFGVAPRDGDKGDPGEPAVMYNIEASSDVITVDANGIVKRGVTYTLKKIVGSVSSPDTNYFPWIRWYNESLELASKTPASKSESITLSESYPLATRVVIGFSGAYLGAEVMSRQFNIVRDNPIPFPRSEEWNMDLKFKNGEYLMHEDVVYMWSSPGEGNSPVNPKDDVQNNPGTTCWKVYQNWPLLSTEVLLARFALLAGAVAYDNRLYSQFGKDTHGEDTGEYRAFNPGTNVFTPNILLDWLTGFAHFAGKKVLFNPDGSGYLANGNIAWDIEGNPTVCGILKAKALYSNFHDIFNWDDYNSSRPTAYDPAIHGSNIILDGGGVFPTLDMPDASLWDGLTVYGYTPFPVSRLDLSVSLRSSKGFVYDGWNTWIDGIKTIFATQSGLCEIRSIKGRWYVVDKTKGIFR